LFLKSPPELILASTSSYRRALLARVQESFACEAPGVDETRREHESALALVARLALGKARAVAARHTEAWVIGSDQVAVLENSAGEELVLGKPGTAERSAQTLRRCSGMTVTYVTGVALVRASDASAHEFVDTTRVKFRELDEATIARYIARIALGLRRRLQKRRTWDFPVRSDRKRGSERPDRFAADSPVRPTAARRLSDSLTTQLRGRLLRAEAAGRFFCAIASMTAARSAGKGALA